MTERCKDQHRNMYLVCLWLDWVGICDVFTNWYHRSVCSAWDIWCPLGLYSFALWHCGLVILLIVYSITLWFSQGKLFDSTSFIYFRYCVRLNFLNLLYFPLDLSKNTFTSNILGRELEPGSSSFINTWRTANVNKVTLNLAMQM